MAKDDCLNKVSVVLNILQCSKTLINPFRNTFSPYCSGTLTRFNLPRYQHPYFVLTNFPGIFLLPKNKSPHYRNNLFARPWLTALSYARMVCLPTNNPSWYKVTVSTDSVWNFIYQVYCWGRAMKIDDIIIISHGYAIIF